MLTSNFVDGLTHIKQVLHFHFRIKDLDTLKYFLGLEVAYSVAGILCQWKYCPDLATNFGVLGSKPISTLMDNTLRLHQDSGPLLLDPLPYKRLIGRLIYLTNTRPHIAFTTQQLSQFMSLPPTQTHLRAATRVLKYLKGCPRKGLSFSRESPIQILGFSDADWATCIDSSKSITWYCFFLGSSLISWKAKKQNTVSRSSSSSEAKYRALTSTTCELQWLTYLLKDLHVTLIYCDNQSALQ